MKLLECVPNFSEGRNHKCINQIAQAIRETASVHLLDVHSSEAANRTVITFVGEPDAVLEAAYRAAAQAIESIDMRNQTGNHPRLGAMDVCPLVPLSGLSLADCVEFSLKLAERIAIQLNLPVYLYAGSARRPERTKLSFLRRGEYDGLAQRIVLPEFAPDFGPAKFNERGGATIIGARHILIAYNVNLQTPSLAVAKAVAAQIRKKRDAVEMSVQARPGFPSISGSASSLSSSYTAIGWELPSLRTTQISMNLLDFERFGLFEAYQEVGFWAATKGTVVTGSEIVGLLPKRALLLAAERFSLSGDRAKRQNSFGEKALIDIAINRLGLSQLSSFEPDLKILDYQLAKLDMLLNI
jgi:glutamate formiminotransferase/formiminotetrahydrofolate cyclodeaminase